MTSLVEASLSFPAVLFSFALVVVIGYWLLVLLGAVGIDALDADVDDAGGAGTAGPAGAGGLFTTLGLGGVPSTVVVSLLIAVSWFTSLTGVVILDRIEVTTPVAVALGLGALAIALVVAWLLVALVAMPLRRAFANARESSRADFVGKMCTIRTAPLGETIGQAEVTASDGSTALIAIRQTGGESFPTGGTALIFDYDATGQFFWVSPFDAELDPNRPTELPPTS